MERGGRRLRYGAAVRWGIGGTLRHNTAFKGGGAGGGGGGGRLRYDTAVQRGLGYDTAVGEGRGRDVLWIKYDTAMWEGRAGREARGGKAGSGMTLPLKVACVCVSA